MSTLYEGKITLCIKNIEIKTRFSGQVYSFATWFEVFDALEDYLDILPGDWSNIRSYMDLKLPFMLFLNFVISCIPSINSLLNRSLHMYLLSPTSLPYP